MHVHVCVSVSVSVSVFECTHNLLSVLVIGDTIRTKSINATDTILLKVGINNTNPVPQYQYFHVI